MPTRFRLVTALVLASCLAAGACDGEGGNPIPIGPGPDQAASVLVLNSTGQTIARFAVGDTIAVDDSPIDLGGAFDGVTVGANETYAVTTVSEFLGSLMLFARLEDRLVLTTVFPNPEADSANPSRAAFDDAGVAWVAGRRSNAIYAAMPGDDEATRVAEDVGEFVEAVLPVGEVLVAVDANIDDDGGTYAPLGPSRVFVLDGASGAVLDTIPLPEEALNAIDAVRVGDHVVVLVGGTLDPSTFEPVGDGGLVVVDVPGRSAGPFLPLDGNGVAIEAGADGKVYVTSTDDFVATELTSLNPGLGSFVSGPSNPISTRTADGTEIDCWVATALKDGRLLCATFRASQTGSLYLLNASGQARDRVNSGFGSTDLLLN